MLDTESKSNQLTGKAEASKNHMLQLNKAIEKGNSDLLAKRKDDKYKQEIQDAANGKPASPNTKAPGTLEQA